MPPFKMTITFAKPASRGWDDWARATELVLEQAEGICGEGEGRRGFNL